MGYLPQFDGCLYVGCGQLKAADAYENNVNPHLEHYCAACYDKQAKAGGRRQLVIAAET